MSFPLVPKSVTLNDHERRNGPYFALFHRIFVYDIVAKQLLGLSRFQDGVDAGLYMYDVVVKGSRSLSHLLMSYCLLCH